MRELLGGRGSVVGERYFNLRARRGDFLPLIADLKRVKPDVIFSTVVGDGTVHFDQAYKDAGLDSREMPIASLTTTEAEIRAMGLVVGEGHITAASYFQGIDNPANASFVSQFKKRWGDGEPTNMCVEAAYFQVFLFSRALEMAGTLDTDVLRAMALGSSIDAPQGRVSIDPACGHSSLWTRIGRANRSGQFDIVGQSGAPVRPDPFLTVCVGVAAGLPA